MTILVTGATGAIGRLVVEQLVDRQVPVRALSRSPHKAALPAAVDVVAGDLADPGSLTGPLFDQVSGVFVFPAETGVEALAERAARAGADHLVVLSSLAAAGEHARDLRSPSYAHHRAVEESVSASGIPATVLRPGPFANNLLAWSHAIRSGDTVQGPYAKSAQAPIHEADIAAVAVEALTTDTYRGATLHLTGPEALTRAEQLRTIGNALGRTLTYQEISPGEFRSAMSRFMPEPIITMLLDHWSDTVDRPDTALNTVQDVTGRPARTLAQWAADHAADFGG
ncbi:SDR family oxidoreductase [Spirillospora sp. NPDC048911]|uniref:SDR family oxidoreductase n=1 Tax=Spirillospora sp. NPDC048911 TaxID=3364527 RepID=UPI003710BC09